MTDNCGRCGSTDLEHKRWDIWHYMRNCHKCGAKTRFNSKGKVVWVKGGKDSDSSSRMDLKYTGHIEGHGSVKSIINNMGRSSGTIDSYGNIKDSIGNISGHVDSFGNIRDIFGNIKGSIDSLGNVRKS